MAPDGDRRPSEEVELESKLEAGEAPAAPPPPAAAKPEPKNDIHPAFYIA